MAAKKKASAKAPTSKKPVVNARKPDGKKIGIPTKAEKKAFNQASHAEGRVVAQKILVEGKELGKTVVGRPPAAPTERYWRKPEVEWTDALGEDLFILMSTGHGMEAISKIDGMPSVYQMMRWFADKTHPFTSTRERAQESLVPFYEELAKDIALTTNNSVFKTRRQVVTRDGDVVWVTERREADNVARSALAVSTLQWTLGHLKPKKHGRNPDMTGDKPNEQLEGLFAALKAGPVK